MRKGQNVAPLSWTGCPVILLHLGQMGVPAPPQHWNDERKSKVVVDRETTAYEWQISPEGTEEWQETEMTGTQVCKPLGDWIGAVMTTETVGSQHNPESLE